MRQYACLNDVLLPALGTTASNYWHADPWTQAQTCQWLEQYFEREVEPVLSPLGLTRPVHSRGSRTRA